MTKKLVITTGYVGAFTGSHLAAWHHSPWLALALAGIAFHFLSRTYR